MYAIFCQKCGIFGRSGDAAPTKAAIVSVSQVHTHTPTPSVQLEGLVGAAFRCTLPKTKAKINIFGRYAYHLLPTSLPSAVMPATLTFILVSLLLLKKESLRRPSLSVLTFGFQ